MNKFEKELTESNRNLKRNTIIRYLQSFRNLLHIFNQGKFKSYNFLKDYDKNTKILDNLPEKKTFQLYKIILVVLQVNKGSVRRGYKEIHQKYQEDFLKLRRHQNKIKDSGVKTQRESDNWVNWPEITTHFDVLYNKFYTKYYDEDGNIDDNKLSKYGFDELIELQSLLILSLYTQLPPRRLEYAYTKYLLFDNFNKLSEDELDNNIYLVTVDEKNMFFSFGKNMIKNKTKSNLQVKLTQKLNNICYIYLNINYILRGQTGDNSLLFNSYKKQMSSTSLSLYLTKYFLENFNKKISISMLRKIYHTHHTSAFKKQYNKIKETSQIMNHSTSMAFKYYCKNTK